MNGAGRGASVSLNRLEMSRARVAVERRAVGEPAGIAWSVADMILV